ncbi:MAG: aminotransferase class I/II-fold pyridoxal phosphate-dependent enzyme [Lachnospiraceae bacterium]|nr:aminotransferase class I/II-fold pyridoxal phosphate-dependent enzyme [Lachnospiraceae bacterium]
MKNKKAFHGSDLELIEKKYGIPREKIINFAANVNPLGISPLVRKELIKNIDTITTYPDRDYTVLKESIASYCNVSPNFVAIGNGSTELIGIMTAYLAPKKALLLSPTYSEYEKGVKFSGGEVDYFRLHEEDNFEIRLDELKDTLASDYDLFILCNPNNPTSSHITTSQMESIISMCKEKNIFVMIDETYVEFAPPKISVSSVSLSYKYDNFIVLRGVSKFFASPGLRLGYAITSNQKLLETIAKNQYPWCVNSIAELAGTVMYRDTDYREETAQLIHKEQQRIYKIFQKSKQYKAYPPSANFILLKILDPHLTSADIFDACIKKGLMIRDCSTFPFMEHRYIRFCFMNPKDNDKLVKLLLSL